MSTDRTRNTHGIETTNLCLIRPLKTNSSTPTFMYTIGFYYAGRFHDGKRNVSVWCQSVLPSVCLSVQVGIYSVTYQGQHQRRQPVMARVYQPTHVLRNECTNFSYDTIRYDTIGCEMLF